MRPATPATLAAAALLFVGALRAPAAEPSRPSLDALEREYAAHVLQARPDLAWRMGLREAATRLAPVTEATLESDLAWLDRFRERLASLQPGSLRASAVARLDSLNARSERERASIRPGGPLRTDATAYRSLGDLAVLEVITTPRVGACERTRRATRRLRAIPEVLRAAAVNLRDAPQDRARVRDGIAESIRVLRTQVVAAAGQCREPGRSADFVEADSAAIRAYERFAELLPYPSEPTP